VEDDLTYTGKADFVTKVVKATDAVFGVFVIVVLDEAKPEHSQQWNQP